ncbi:hypothetical protein ACFRFH_11080 [Leifsonia sp. NPDC056824]|uniref:hypothetical protein n=1 Tax=Leifsonia sp. NPDC056824 TaxID=3345953 RepID=UPI0036C8D1B2
MNAIGWIVLIVVIVVIVVGIIIVVSTVGRRRKVEADRQRATELREAASRDELAAREREAKSARAAADAKQAEVDAERLRREADERERAAAAARDEQQDKLSRADDVDPDVETDRHGNRVVADGAVDDTRRDEVPPPRPAAETASPAHDAPRIDGITGEERRVEDRP